MFLLNRNGVGLDRLTAQFTDLFQLRICRVSDTLQRTSMLEAEDSHTETMLTKDTGHRSVGVGSRKWAWECWDSRGRAARSATAPLGLPGRT